MAWVSWRRWWTRWRRQPGEQATHPPTEHATQRPTTGEPATPQPDREPDTDDAAPSTAASDELDLHTFAPREVADVVEEFVRWSAEQGLRRVRIIHGKGTGTLRRIVHAALARHGCVVAHGLCDERSGGWGATWAHLCWPPQSEQPGRPAPSKR